MTIRLNALSSTLLALCVGVAAPAPSLAGETTTFNAFSVWEATGQTFQTAPGSGTWTPRPRR